MRLRHFVTGPPVVEDNGTRVERSTLLILDTLQADTETSIADIAELLDVTHSTASRLVKRAAEVGAVRTSSQSQDRRKTVIEATRRGSALRQRAITYRAGRLEEILAGWTNREISTFTELLERFATSATTSGQERS